MKIAINALSAKTGGGVTYLNRLIFNLGEVDEANEYWIFVTHENRERVIAFEDARFHVVEVWIPHLLYRLYYEQFVLPITLKRLDVDVIYAPAEVAPLLTSCPIVLGVQNPNVYYPSSVRWSAYDRMRFLALRLLARLSAKLASHVVFVSETARQDISRMLNIPLGKTSAVHHGVETTDFSPQKDKTEPSGGVGSVCNMSGYILCVSHLYGHKNHRVLVEAYGALPDPIRAKVKLVLVGQKINPYYDELIGVMREMRIREDDVVFCGEMCHEELAAIYRGASVFVLPSYLETFGIPLIEAMASGLPIIASNASAIPEVVGNAGLLFDPASPHELCELVKEVLSDAALRRGLVLKSLERAQGFTWRNTAVRMVKIVEQVHRENGKSCPGGGEVMGSER